MIDKSSLALRRLYSKARELFTPKMANGRTIGQNWTAAKQNFQANPNQYNLFANMGDALTKPVRNLPDNNVARKVGFGLAGASELPSMALGFGGQRNQQYLRNMSPSDDTARRVGSFAYKTAAFAPLGGAKSAIQLSGQVGRNVAFGAGLGTAFGAGGALLQGRLPTKQELLQGAATGAENSAVFPVINKATDLGLRAGGQVLGRVAPKLGGKVLSLTDDAIGASARNIKHTRMNKIPLLAKHLGKSVTREVLETPGESAYFSAMDMLNPDEKRKYGDIYKERFAGDLVGNVLFGTARGLGGSLIKIPTKAEAAKIAKQADIKIEKVYELVDQRVNEAAAKVSKSTGEPVYRLSYEDGGKPYDIVMDKKNASDWTAYLLHKGIDYRLDPLGKQGGYIGGGGNKPPTDPLSSLKQEARKYKSAEEFVSNQISKEKGFRDAHQMAPGVGDYSIKDVFAGKSGQPQDILTTAGLKKYGNDSFYGKETIDAINKARKTGKITIYRAVPKDVSDVGNGEWVYFSKNQADAHGLNRLNGEYKVLSKEVPAKDVFWDGNDIREWGYDSGSGGVRQTKYDRMEELRKLWKQANGDTKQQSGSVEEQIASLKQEARFLEQNSEWDKLSKVQTDIENLKNQLNQSTTPKVVGEVRAGDVISFTDKYGKTTVGTVGHSGRTGLGSEQKLLSVTDANGNKVQLRSQDEINSIKVVRKGLNPLDPSVAFSKTFDDVMTSTQKEFETLRDSKELSNLAYYKHLLSKFDRGEITKTEFSQRLSQAKINQKAVETGLTAEKRLEELRNRTAIEAAKSKAKAIELLNNQSTTPKVEGEVKLGDAQKAVEEMQALRKKYTSETVGKYSKAEQDAVNKRYYELQDIALKYQDANDGVIPSKSSLKWTPETSQPPKVETKTPVQTQSLDQGRVALPQGQDLSSPKKVKVKAQANQPVGKQELDAPRTNVSSKGSITGNPIKDDITGVKPSGIVDKLRKSVQDNWIEVKNLQRQKGVKVTESSNPYLAEELYHGRVGTRIENIKTQVVDFDKELLSTSKKVNVPDTQLKTDVNKYLQAKHAPERNKIHGDGAAGMTNAEAAKYLKEIEGSPVGVEVKRLSAKIKQMNDQTLDVLLESQVIDKQLYDTLRTNYKNHVPLNRIMDNENIADILTGKGFNVKSSGIKKAKGSEREVADILGNVVVNLESAIVRAEKNRVNLATLEFARNNPQLGIFSEIKPKAIGETFDGKVMTQEVKDPLVLTVRENGKPVYLKINDETLAPVFQGIGNEKLPGAFKFIQSFTQFYSGLHTRFNPEFALSNVIRDSQEMAVFMAAQKDIGFKGSGKTLARIPSAQKAVLDSMRGVDSEGAKLYQQMRLDGGTTGGMALSTRKAVDLDLKKIEQLNRSKPRKAAQKLLESFDNWNTIFEDGTRLAVYKESLAKGMSRKEAASLAKNSTVNFNKKGTATPIINSLYMFSNASVQGSVKMLRAMKDPKVAGAVVTTVGASVFAVNNWNDQVDPDWRDKVREWDRNSNMVVMLPSTDGAKYITIPASWGIKPIKVAADVAYDLMTGQSGGVQDAAVRIAESAFDAYNPTGGEDVMSALTPTILDLPMDISRNKSWAGGNIRPDWLKGLPASEQMFANTGESTTGKIAIKTTDTLAKAGIQVSPNDLLYAYNSLIGGVGKAASRTVNTVTAIATGSPLVAKEVPFANRFYKTASEEQVQKSLLYKGQANFLQSLQKYQTGSDEQKEAIRNHLRGLGSDQERQSILFKLRDQGFDTKGISYSGKKLGVANVPLKSDKVRLQQTPDQPQNIVDKIALAAQGMTKDPATTIKAIFTQEELRKIEGNAVILKRQEFLNKANDPNLQRDHIIPLGLGGDNSESNLMYVPKDWHTAKTKNDNRLIRELQSGKITRQEAQKQVKAWIEANPHETYIMERPVTGTQVNTGSAYQQAKQKKVAEKEAWSELNKIQKDEYLTQQEKDTQSIALLSELGISAKDYQYHEVAKETNDLKSLYVEEELVKMMAQNKSKDEIYAWLVDQRREVNGKMVLAPGVIDYLVDQNILSYSEGKKLKAVKVDKKGTKVKTSKAKKAKVPKLKKISIKAIKPPKVKIVKSASSKFKNPKVKKINIRRFNKVANRK